MKLFQNKFFIICLSVALVLCIVPSTFSIMGYTGLTETILEVVSFPVRWLFSSVADGLSGWGMYFSSIDVLSEQNAALKAERDALQAQIERAELLEAENERLRAYLGMMNAYPSFKMEEAMVISHAAGNYMTLFTLNKGSLHGIEQGLPVVTADGIVGYVSEVSLNTCRVSTILETATSVGALVERSGEIGIVSGDYSMRYDGLCSLGYMKENADVQIGDRIISSGTGSVYPSGLTIGHVTEVSVDEYSRMLTVSVSPAVDLTNVKWVMILTDYETSGGEVEPLPEP